MSNKNTIPANPGDAQLSSQIVGKLKSLLIAGETPEELQELISGLEQSLKPANLLAQRLLQELAWTIWRLDRVHECMTLLHKQKLTGPEGNEWPQYANLLGFQDLFDVLHKYESHLKHDLFKLIESLSMADSCVSLKRRGKHGKR
jgi:hypothetical protein